MTTPLYYSLRGIPMTEKEVAESLGVTTEALRENAELMVRDAMMCKDSDGNYHHSPVSDGFVGEIRH
jgi:predicted transcriptional regulator